MESDYFEILSFIELIRDSFDGSVEVYTNGSCFRFALILSKMFPGGKILEDGDHAIYKKGKYCFDITGEVEKGSRVEIFQNNNYSQVFKLFNLKYMTATPNNDPLGIHALQSRMEALQDQLGKIEKSALFGEELPVAESIIIEKTGLRKSALLSLRNNGKLRFGKVGKDTVYLPSQFKEDILNLK
jgi:hypothetical protein